jgi:hypothetical protein
MQSVKFSPSDLSNPPHHAKSFDDFASPIDLTFGQTTIPIGGATPVRLPVVAACSLYLVNADDAEPAVFELGIGRDEPVTITLPPNREILLRGAWTSIQGATGGAPEATAFWQDQSA